MQILAPNSFALAEHKRNVWQAYPEPEITAQDLLVPAYWSNAAALLRAYDRIEVLAEDGAWWGEYLVLEVGHNWAKVALLRSHELKQTKDTPDVVIPDDYEIKHRGIRKYSVIRKGDGVVLKDGIQNKEEAVGWLGEHLKSMAS